MVVIKRINRITRRHHKKVQSGRADLAGNDFHWRRSQNGLSGDGYLVQTVDKVPDVDANGNSIDRYISGRISTAGLVSPIYGFYEARLDTLPVEGMQSAWWLWAENGLWNYDWNRNWDFLTNSRRKMYRNLDTKLQSRFLTIP